MGVTNSNKVIDRTRIDCEGALRVTLALTAVPDILSNPTDIVLVLDRSGSMAGTPMANMKTGAKIFVDIMAEATGDDPSQIGSGSRIGMVSFANTAAVNAPLSTSVNTLKSAIDQLSAGGSINHAAAFNEAINLFDPNSNNAKVMVMFTDGNTTTGAPPAPVAAAARVQGIIIYCIGLIGSDGLDINTLNHWATDPDASHVAVTPNEEDLIELFAELAANISKTGATDIVMEEVLNPDFEITSVMLPTKGTATMTGSNTLRWTIPELGVMDSESASLDFFIRHTAQTTGTKLVNESITYSDAEGKEVFFPEPTVEVDCTIVVHPEACPVPVEFTVDHCTDAVLVDMGEVRLESQGQIIQLDVTIPNVCPGKRVALAAILTEIDSSGTEQPRGMKTMTIPAHDAPGCRDVLVKCIPFVVPAEGDDTLICGPRQFNARLIAHTIDTDYRCCDAEITL